MQRQLYYLNDFLDYAFIHGDESLQERSAEYLDKAQSLVDWIQENKPSSENGNVVKINNGDQAS